MKQNQEMLLCNPCFLLRHGSLPCHEPASKGLSTFVMTTFVIMTFAMMTLGRIGHRIIAASTRIPSLANAGQGIAP